MTESGTPRAAVLMCHAPIVIPAIGGARGVECRASTEAMGQAARVAADCGAETLVVLSPHLPRHPEAFGVVTSPSVQGDFGAFGRPELGCRFPADAAAAAAGTRGTGVSDLGGSALLQVRAESMRMRIDFETDGKVNVACG